jgi:hypothetical protein
MVIEGFLLVIVLELGWIVGLLWPKTVPDKSQCYWCQGWFETAAMEKQGEYWYCPKHGRNRG